ncbi:Subtilisin Carlsberg precursor [Luteitalea pratensis]|uniref:Subtilisin Carlsberg n=1 Tax=Luteitalea pratensis TaxID=1855912 RepID=A0A143PI59_LUTPR|nr:Subtilisin Carlsberg precursor [Luteitalea pratensis]
MVLTLLLLALAAPATAQPGAARPGDDGRVARLTAGAPSDTASATAIAGWRQRVRVDPTIRLIVLLATADPTAPALNAAARAANAGALGRVVARLGPHVRAARTLSTLPLAALDVDADGLETLLADPSVATVEEDQALQRALAQSVPLVQADRVWAQGYRGFGWAVAVLDDGLDTGHPAFGGRVVAEACYSGHGSPGSSICPGGVFASTAAGSAAPCPGCTHGTHVAGIAAGSTGVAPESSVIAMQVFSSDGLAYFSDILHAIDRVLVLANTYHVAALNLSLGNGTTHFGTCDDTSPSVFTAFVSLRAVGIAPVVASGNTGTATGLEFPACLSNAVSVGSTSKADVVEAYSDASSQLQLLAPGGAITAPVSGGGYATKSGTSMAAPHVAGAWALLRQRVPAASVSTILAALSTTGVWITDARTGALFPRIRIADAAEAIATLGISPTTWAPLATGGTQAVVVTSAPAAASWSASTDAAWLSVSPASGVGSGSTTLTATAHTTSALPRTATATIAGHSVAVTQSGATPTLTLSATTWEIGPAAATRMLTLTSSLPDATWSATSSQPWLTVVPAAGTGSATLGVSVSAHTSSVSPRTAAITVAGQTFTVMQAGATPSITAGPTAVTIAAAGGTAPVALNVSPSDAPWTASADASWLVLDRVSGAGDATITITAGPHSGSAFSRTGTVTIGGQAVTVKQAGATPSFMATPSSVDLSAAGGAVTITLTSTLPDASWTASSTTPWLAVQPQSGIGSTIVTVTVAPHTLVQSRSGTVSVAGQVVTLSQQGAPSVFTASPLSLDVPVGGALASVVLTTTATNAPWTAVSDVAWLSVTPTSGHGSATLDVAVDATTPAQPRTGTITVAGHVITVMQGGGAPAASITETAWIAPITGGTRALALDVSGSTGSWTATSDAAWLTVSPVHGTGDSDVLIAALPSGSNGAGLPSFALPSTIPTTTAVVVVSQPFDGGIRTGTLVFTPHPPTTLYTRYLAEGASSAFFDTCLALLNPGTVATTATLSFLRSGREPLEVQVDVPAGTRRTVWPRDHLGPGDAQFSTIVSASQPLVVDRTMTWDGSGYGAHAETATTEPSPRWYFAEGATHSGFALFYLLQNPGDATVTARVRYLRAGAPPIEKTYTLAPRSRTNIWANLEEFPGLGRALASTEVSAVIETTGGEPIIAERAMYRSTTGRLFDAGHESMGVRAPSTRWFLAEGRTGPFFDEFILLANPADVDASVRITYLLDDGRTYVRTLVAPAAARTSLWVDHETIDGVAGEPLADVALSATVESLNGVPLMVERAMWWPGDGSTWHEAHASAGAVETGVMWAMAEGEVGGDRAAQTYVLMANTSTFEGRARVTLLFEDGQSASRIYGLPASSRTNAAIGPDFGAVVDRRRFGVIVEALGTDEAAPVPRIVVERAMYSDANGVALAAGTNALATRLR